MCAEDKNPKMPIEVMNIKTTTALTKYVLSNSGQVFQFRYNQDAVTSFPTSRTTPIMIIGRTAAENIFANPNIE